MVVVELKIATDEHKRKRKSVSAREGGFKREMETFIESLRAEVVLQIERLNPYLQANLYCLILQGDE
ncbi:hypothetical protein TorRG33x02_131060, partial [Trema orientale]